MIQRLNSVKRIILSIGHGGSKGEKFDTGAEANGITESDQCKIITTKLQALLTLNKIPVLVIPDYGLAQSCNYINSVGNAYSDWAIELHKDSADYVPERMHRRMGVYAHPESSGAMRIAKEMAATFILNGAHRTSWARPDTDSRHGVLAFVRRLKMLSMIVECGFIQGDCSDAENDFYAQAICDAILTSLDRKRIPV